MYRDPPLTADQRRYLAAFDRYIAAWGRGDHAAMRAAERERQERLGPLLQGVTRSERPPQHRHAA